MIRNATSRSRSASAFRDASTIAALRDGWGSALVTVSSANAFSYGRRKLPLRDYLDHMAVADYSGAQTADGLFYWFGEHGEELAPLLRMYPLPVFASSSAEADLLAFALSDNAATSAAPPPPPALSFGAGSDGSGVPFHHHNDGLV